MEKEGRSCLSCIHLLRLMATPWVRPTESPGARGREPCSVWLPGISSALRASRPAWAWKDLLCSAHCGPFSPVALPSARKHGDVSVPRPVPAHLCASSRGCQGSTRGRWERAAVCQPPSPVTVTAALCRNSASQDDEQLRGLLSSRSGPFVLRISNESPDYYLLQELEEAIGLWK